MSRLEKNFQDKIFEANECVIKAIKDIADTNIGLATTVTKHKTDDGVLLIHNSDIQENQIVLKSCEYITEEFAKKNEKKRLRSGDVITVHTGDVGTSAVVTDEYNGAIGFTTITSRIKDTSEICPEYLCHYLNSHRCKQSIAQMTISDRSNLNQKNFDKIMIPIPPMETQKRIVNVLDNFAELTAELTVELTAELTARKQQYEYYRDLLLTFDRDISKVVWKPLSNIADIGTGSSNTNEGLEEGLYPFYVRSQEPLRMNEYEFDETAIVTAGDGVGVGKVFHYVEGKYALHQRAYRIHINTPEVLPRYYFHYMRSAFLPYIQKAKFHGSVSSIRRPMLNEFPVPIPDLSIQKKIIDVLDNFEAICSDLSKGLPAEIKARQKQYEYYRDKLLTFKEQTA